MKIILRIVITLILLITTGWAALTILLPIYLQTSLMPELAANAGIDNFQPHAPHLGLTDAGGGFHIGSAKSPALTVSSLAARYTLPGLFGKKIKQISLNGVELRFIFRDNQLLMDDSSLQKLLTSSSSQNNKPKKTEQQLPVFIESIVIKQATLICRANGRHYRIPFEAEINWPSAGNTDQADIEVSLYPRGQQIKLTGSIDRQANAGTLSLSSTKLNPKRFSDLVQLPNGLDLHALVDLAAQADLRLSPFACTDFKAALSFHEPVIGYNEMQLGLANGNGPASIQVTLNSEKQKDADSWTFQLSSNTTQLYAVFKENKVDIPSSVLSLRGKFSAAQADIDWQHNFSLSMDNENIQAGIPEILLKGRTSWQKGTTISTNGILHFSNGSLHHQSSGVQAEKIHLNLPIKWPLTPQTPSGEFGCKKIRFKDTALGSLTGEIWPTKDAVQIETNYLSTLFPDLSIDFELISSLAGNGTTLKVEIPPYQLTDFDPVILTDKDQGMLFSGIIEGQADMKLAKDGQEGTAQLTLSKGSMAMPDKKLTISGIESSIVLPNLPEFRSAPSQKIKFHALNFKDFSVTDGTLIFSLESPQSFFLEKGAFNWAQGSIHTSAIRFAKQQPQTELNLYCYKLKLATILKQVGIENVTGDGALNGRIPITIKGNRLTFAESFLYSTPGQGGHVRIAETDYLTKAIPLNTPQFAQLDFAQEALRDFNYKWAKLHLITEDESLVLQLQLDGKPAQPLPFSYNSATGNLRRQKDQQGGISQPIRLDVNFRFPLNTFLEYDKSIKDMLQSIQ